MPPEQAWQTAENHFNRGRYNRAAPYYQQLVFDRTSVYVAEAQFKLGESYFRRRGRDYYVDAIFEFQEFLRLFPDHRLAADAQFRIGQAYVRISLPAELTQEDSHRAIDNFIRFIERFPLDPRISQANQYIMEMQIKQIEKTYLTGYIYFKMRDFPAAALYLNEIIALGNRNELEKNAMYYIARIHIDRREIDEALVALEHLQRHFPDSRETNRIEKRFQRRRF